MNEQCDQPEVIRHAANVGGPLSKYPARQVTFIFYHPTFGDGVFCIMVESAVMEYLKADPDGRLSFFKASNGIELTIKSGFDQHGDNPSNNA